MKHFKNFISEAREVVDMNTGVSIYYQPSFRDMLKISRESRYDSARFFFMKDNSIYAWNADDTIHKDAQAWLFKARRDFPSLNFSISDILIYGQLRLKTGMLARIISFTDSASRGGIRETLLRMHFPMFALSAKDLGWKWTDEFLDDTANKSRSFKTVEGLR